MGKPIVITHDGFRVLIDPEDKTRKPSEIVEYKLSPEEIEARYGKPNESKQAKKPFIETYGQISEKERDSMKPKITKEQLTAECRNLGFTMKAYADIAKRYGFASPPNCSKSCQ